VSDLPLRSFGDRTALITGGASGIGLAIAERLAKERCHLRLVDVHSERLRQAQQRLTSIQPNVTIHECDVSDKAAVFRLAQELTDADEQLHLLVNCAGVSAAGSFDETSLDDFEWVMGVNFWGTVFACKAFLPILKRQDEAHIVNVSSVFGLLGFARKSGYSASKFAVRGFTEALRMELASSSVGVTLLYPGPVDTNIVRDGRAVSEEQKQAETAFLARRAISTEYVAARTLRGIRRNSARVLLGVDYHVADWLVRLSPALAQKAGAWFSRRMPF
jgi:short-subunit dehydrogenase